MLEQLATVFGDALRLTAFDAAESVIVDKGPLSRQVPSLAPEKKPFYRDFEKRTLR